MTGVTPRQDAARSDVGPGAVERERDRRPETTSRAEAAAWAVAAVTGIALAAVGVAQADPDDIDGLGLFTALPAWYFAGVAVLLATLAVAIVRDRHLVVWGLLVSVTVLLHGLPGFIEPHPRFVVAWLHAGITDHIAEEGELLVFLDARFSWPGFFSTSAFLQRIADTESLRWMIRFMPVVVNLIAAVAVWNLARVLRYDRAQANLAATIFVLVNWIGQDYFAPQSLAFLLALVLVTVVLAAFPADPTRSGWTVRLLAPRPIARSGVDDQRAMLLYATVLVVAATIVVTHQLTPAFLGASLLLLGLFRRIRAPMLGPIVFVLMLGWLAFGAEAFWIGHLDDLFGSFGDIGGVVDANVAERRGGGSADRDLVLRARTGLILVVWVAALAVMLAQRRRRDLDPATVALFAGPFVTVIAQPYGGELLLRVALFTLPICAVLIAGAVLRSSRVFTSVMLGVALVAVLPVFVLARFGNESYEQVTSNDLAITELMYDTAPDGSLVYVASRQTLIDLERLDEVRFRDVPEDLEMVDFVARLRSQVVDEDRHVYVLLTESQAAYGREALRRPPDWAEEYAAQLLGFDVVEERARLGDAVLLEVVP